jgi:hypothetical protein
MKRFYQLCVALVLGMLAATSASAGEMISLQKVRFCTWDGWFADANPTGKADCAWVIGEETGQPYGDPSVINYADLSKYSKLVVVAKGGGTAPRFQFNRTKEGGTCNADESQSFMLEYPNFAWTDKYFTKTTNEEGYDVYTCDIKKIVTDKGFAHLHAIKVANWGQTTVYSMEVEKGVQIGWTDVIENGDLEWDDNSSFYTKVDRGEPAPSEITDGVGVNGSRGIVVAATAKVNEPWDNQFWIYANETLPAGTKYKLSFDYRADVAAKATTQAHAEPSDYIHYIGIGDVEFIPDWQTFETEGEISADQSKDDHLFHSWAFNLSELAEANNYYFDNIKFQVLKFGTQAEFSNDVILIDFGFDTNIPELVKAAGKPRIFYPNECVTVKVNGEAVDLYSVEGLADGRFYIFLNDGVQETDNVQVSFANPTDAALQLIYRSGVNTGKVIADFQDVQATMNSDIEDNEGYPWDFVKPRIAKADPEDGSFNLPNSINEFKVTFDKEAQVAELQAALNGAALTVTAIDAADGLATDFVLTRDGADLADGEYTLTLNNVQPKETGVGDFGNYEIVLNIGKVADDPDDVEELVMTDDFAASGASWIVTSDTEGQMQDANSGAGCRLMHGQSGFASDILYLGTRTVQGVALYGTKDDAKLTLKAKNYHLTLNAAMWDGSGAQRSLKVQVLADGAVDVTNGNILDESQILVEEMKAVEPDFKTSTNATHFDVVVPVTTEGNYIIRLVAGNANGDAAAWGDASAVGNIKVEYLPNKIGAEWVRLLKTALESAKKVQEKYADERYAGEAQTALNDAIAKYETEMAGYTAPSVYQAAADDLDALGVALEAHGKLCGDYDTQIKSALDVVRQVAAELDNGKPNEKHKFASTDMYANLCEVVGHYHGSSEWRDINEDPEGEPNMQLFYEFDKLTDDAALNAAIAELKDITNLTSLLFTTGASQGTTTGYAAEFERIRLGIAGLKALGVAEDDALLVEANKTLGDDDDVAEALMNRTTLEVYGKLKGSDNIFETVDDTDPENPIVSAKRYDMTVFAKNPNVYKVLPTLTYSPENIPGWSVSGSTGLWCGWNNSVKNIEGIAEDCSFTVYHAAGVAELTVTNLPAGVYTVVVDAARWDEVDPTGQTFAYIKTSATPAVEDGAEPDKEVNYAATADLAYYGQYVMNHDNEFENVTITDGQLTMGVNFASDEGQYFFDKVKLYLTGKAEGFDYAKAYEDAVAGIQQTAAGDGKVRATELYDLNGRRVTKAQKGLVIMKQMMSDGTVRTQKVVK